MDKKDEIRDFLVLLKKVVNDRRSKHILSRRGENKSTMEFLEYTFDDIKKELISLTVENWISGPEKPHGEEGDGEVWEFGKVIREREIYIKVNLYDDEVRYYLVCISFHFSDRKLKLPYLYC